METKTKKINIEYPSDLLNDDFILRLEVNYNIIEEYVAWETCKYSIEEMTSKDVKVISARGNSEDGRSLVNVTGEKLEQLKKCFYDSFYDCIEAINEELGDLEEQYYELKQI